MVKGGPRSNKPTQLKVLQGTARPDRVLRDEPQPDVLSDLKPPAWLDAVGKQHWRYYAAVLQKMRLLTEADVTTLGIYCRAWSRYRHALAKIAATDDDDVEQRWTVRLEKAEASLRLLSHDLGLNPAARSRLSVAPKETAADPMEALLEGRRA